MDFLELAKQRYSERYFDSTPLEEDKLNKILEAGRIVPTACNMQPQRFYVLKTPEAKEKAIKGSLTSLFGAPVGILVCYDMEHTWHNKRETLTENYNSGEQDCAIAATTMIYAAQELGVHSIYLRDFDARQMKKEMNLPDNIIPALMLAFGYPSEKSHPAHLHEKRNPLEDFVTIL